MPKDKPTDEDLALQFMEMADHLELTDERLADYPQWQDRIKEIIAFLPDGVASDLVGRMQSYARDHSVDTQSFAKLHGLTKAEEKLLTSLAAGLSVPDHAKKLDISVNTGRVHMQRILDKTAASGQLDLIKMLHKH